MSNIPLSATYDQWGLTQFPTSTDPAFTPCFDGWGKPQLIPSSEQALAVILDFLGCWLVTDGLVSAAWREIAGAAGGRPVKSVYLHNPADVSFNESATPSLYLWREDAAFQRDADDWRRDHSTVKGLWVFPAAFQEKQRVRIPFAPVLAKAIDTAIERGRTTSWVQPGDPDPASALQGSLFYSFAGFDRFELTHWKTDGLRVKGSEKIGGYRDYPAIAFTFAMIELLQEGLGRSPPYFLLKGITDTVQTETDAPFTTWAPNTPYALNAFVIPPVPNNFYYLCSRAGVSGSTPPAFPTAPGATVSDGSAQWMCVGIVTTVIDSGPLENPLPPGTSLPVGS